MKITFLVADTHHTRMRLIHENESVPYRRRVVTVALTPEQIAAIGVRVVGSEFGRDVREEVIATWIENEESK